MELIDLAQKNNFYFPTEHVLMPVTPDYLKNDNAKWDVMHRWQPDLRAWDLAASAFLRIKSKIYRGSKPLTFEAALMRAEKMTSCGFLFKQLGFKTKGEVLTKYKDELKYIIDEIMEGVVYLSIWEMAPKVEIRNLQKLINDDYSKRKQRTFMVADTLAYIVGLMLYSEQNDQQTALCDDITDWCGVGISIFNGGWNNLACNLLSKSNEFIACDETAMEACITLEIQDVIYAARNEHIPSTHFKLANWYVQTCQYGIVHDGFGNLYEKVGGNCTGHNNTIHDNNDGSTLKKLYHLGKDCETTDELVEKYHNAGVKIVGDDDVIPYHPMWEGLVESSGEIGFHTKVEAWRVPLTSLSFLNFGFIFDINTRMYTFKANEDKIFSALFLFRKDDSWRLTLARLYAMKILFYTNKLRYYEILHYIDFILARYKPDISGETRMDNIITEHSLYRQDKSPREIESLLYCLESGQNESNAQTLVQEMIMEF